MNTPADKEAFFQLIQKNKGIVWKICNSYCKNAHQREDLAQDIIYELWKSGSRFNNEYKFSTWMYRVALNVAISHYRKTSKLEEVITLTENHTEVADKLDSASHHEENLLKLRKFIDNLEELNKALMILYLEEKPYAEIAEILGISETNVATKISRLKERLKQYLQKSNY